MNRDLRNQLSLLIEHNKDIGTPEEMYLDLERYYEEIKYKIPSSQEKMTQIESIISMWLSMPVEEIRKKISKTKNVYARHLCFYFFKRYTRASYEEMGNYFNGLDHATVSHGLKRIAREGDTDQKLKEDINSLDEIFNMEFDRRNVIYKEKHTPVNHEH